MLTTFDPPPTKSVRIIHKKTFNKGHKDMKKSINIG